MDKLARGGYLISHINLLNGRLFNKFLSEQENSFYSGEQGKILSVLWEKEPLTATDMAIRTGLANNTLTKMLKRMEEQHLIYSESHPQDKRKRHFYLTDLGQEQKVIGQKVSQELGSVFYQGFSPEEIAVFEDSLTRVLTNLQKASSKWKDKL